jgi:hypothetical protein
VKLKTGNYKRRKALKDALSLKKIGRKKGQGRQMKKDQ